MLGRKQYNRIYRDGHYGKYVYSTIKRKIKKYTVDLINSTYLYIRFPFLYPKNRFSDKHYTNWKLRKKMQTIYTKWSNWSNEHVQDYIDKFGKECVFLDDKVVKSKYILKLASFNDRFIYKFYDICETILGYIHVFPTYTELDDIPKGWRKRFGIQMCKEIKEALNKYPDKKYKKEFRILQIKEKWGTLQFYVNLTSDEVQRVIQKYEYISQFVCIDCGEDAVKKTLGWISPYCEKHLPTNQNWKYIDPIYGYSDSEHKKFNEEVEKEIY